MMYLYFGMAVLGSGVVLFCNKYQRTFGAITIGVGASIICMANLLMNVL